MDYAIVDRIEGAFAVCEMPDGTFSDINLDILPCGIHEGSVLVMHPDGWTIDEIEEQSRRERIKKKIAELFED